MRKKAMVAIILIVILVIILSTIYSIWVTEPKYFGNNKREIDELNYSGKNEKLICEGSNPVFSPDGGKILFTGYDSSGYTYGLYLMNVDGSNLKKILDIKLIRDTFSISLDNTKILYHLNDYHEDDSEIWMVNVDGTTNHNIKQGYHATFSPDGKNILYATYEQNDPNNWRDRNNTLRIMDIDGSNDTLIMRTYYPNDILHPMFFSDGKKILFCLDNASAWVERRGYYDELFNENDTFRPGTWTINVDGTDPLHLASDGAAGVSPWTRAVVSMNGNKIMRYGSTHAHHMSLFAMDVDGSNEVQIMEPSYLGTADISRDGKKIVWAWTYEEGAGLNPSNVMQIVGETGIWISNTDGTEEKALVKGYNPRFSPIMNLIVYSNEGKIYTIEYD